MLRRDNQLKIKGKLPEGIEFVNEGLEEGSYDVMLSDTEIKTASIVELLGLPELKDRKEVNLWRDNKLLLTLAVGAGGRVG